MDSKASDESSNFSFTNTFITDQTLNSYTVLSGISIYIKCFGLIKLIFFVFHISIYTLSKYPNKASINTWKYSFKKSNCSILNNRIDSKLFKNTYLYTIRMYSPVTNLRLFLKPLTITFEVWLLHKSKHEIPLSLSLPKPDMFRLINKEGSPIQTYALPLG